MIYSAKANQDCYPFVLPDLPFNKEAFIPYLSKESFEYHHLKHHNAYVTNLNNLLQDKSDMHELSLEQIICNSCNKQIPIFNNAAQIWNHTFFWHSISPAGDAPIPEQMLAQITKDFGSYESFIAQFKQTAISQFGSGWAWLVYSNNKLSIVKTSNADTPITNNLYPLLACDVWEHAYYIDYRNKRPDYLNIFSEKIINWEFAAANLKNAIAYYAS